MRETFTTSQLQAHNMTQTQSSDTAVNTYLKGEINRSKRIIEKELGIYRTDIVRTASTVDGQQYYHYPPNFGELKSIKVTIGSVDYVLSVCESQDEWDRINAITLAANAFPTLVFPRNYDFGIYPIPQDAYTMTMVFTPRHKDLTAEDYETGTIALSEGSTVVTGSGTTFTAEMVGRWLKAPDGLFYRIATFSSTTMLGLESVYEGGDVSGASYTIGESYDFPEELHNLPPILAAANYFIQKRGDHNKGQALLNLFYTGDLNNNGRELSDARGGLLHAKESYAGRSATGIVRRNKVKNHYNNSKLWATSISEA